ncbi:hypothetical protein BJV78DRAFT_1211514 [Lactifluus subvellereus]|nr:hypothetical protein BJV78DRAFT_1211514 [Lactifluus subvellereus]
MDERSLNKKLPISPISQLLQNLGMTRDDLTRHSDQMRQFLTAENANSFRAFAMVESDADGAISPTLLPQTVRAKSRSISSAATDAPCSFPPVTPVKTEPLDPPPPSSPSSSNTAAAAVASSSIRRFESMDEIIERQNRRSKRERRSRRERDDTSPAPGAPSSSHSPHKALTTDDGLLPSNHLGSLSQDSLSHSTTPSRAGRYYRDTVLYQTVTPKHRRTGTFVPRAESPSPSRSRRSSVASSIPSESNSLADTTSQKVSGTHLLAVRYGRLCPSGNPTSHPVRPIVNIVSSPGPMGPEPTEDEYDDLPFKLPPGPYSPVKPDLPYAALIGQAILASPEHRLTLQEIYDFITIVYPHFKRNEQTWMNSIRHVLSTTIVFRKVQRDRAAGRTLWAIFDQDLDCFVGGGFRKEFCADMQEQKEKARNSNRKRPAEDTPTRKPRRKKLKTETEQIPPALHSQMGIPMSTLPAVAYPGPPMFPGPRAGTHHQPYYTPYVMPHPHAVPAGVIFPVLPPGSAYNPATTEPPPPAPPISRPSTSSSAVSRVVKTEPEESPSPSLPPTSSSSASLPELSPNNSSSSPPEDTDDQDAAAQAAESSRASASVSPKFDISAFLVVPEEAPLDALAPGVTLLNPKSTAENPEAALKAKGKSKKGKEKAAAKDSSKKPSLPPAPESPTLVRQTVRPRAQNLRPSTPPLKNVFPTSVKPLLTPPGRPCTPPQKTSDHHLSAARTPLSHLGVHMSPSPSLAHYKSHLNPPPPPVASHPPGDANPPKDDGHPTEDSENLLRTPSRRRASSQFTRSRPESPLRGLFDPHDPGMLLDEELARLGAQGTPGRGPHESPVGFAQRALLYESPNTQSPERWTRMW